MHRFVICGVLALMASAHLVSGGDPGEFLDVMCAIGIILALPNSPVILVGTGKKGGGDATQE